MEFPHWTLTDEEITLSRKKDFDHKEVGDRFYLTRKSDHARIWPHIDGFMSAFIRGGTFVKRKKFVDLPRALDRRFGDI
jgi:hypothetical protein